MTAESVRMREWER